MKINMNIKKWLKNKPCKHNCAMKIVLKNKHATIKKRDNNEWSIFNYKPVFTSVTYIWQKTSFFCHFVEENVNCEFSETQKVLNYQLYTSCTLYRSDFSSRPLKLTVQKTQEYRYFLFTKETILAFAFDALIEYIVVPGTTRQMLSWNWNMYVAEC